MNISNLEELLQLDNNVYFRNLEVKENKLYIFPEADSHSNRSTNELLNIHMKLEPFSDMYDILLNFDKIVISPKSEFYE